MVVDQFGIKQIYRSSSLKQKSFHLPMQVDPNATEITLPSNFGVIGSPLVFVRSLGSFFIDYWELSDYSDRPFLVFLSQNGFIPGPNCNLNHSTAVSQGFATSPEDWQNVEITGHFFIKKRSGSSDIDAMRMTGREGIANTTTNNCCSVTGYGAIIETSEATDKEGFVSLFKRPHSGLSKAKFLTSVSPAGFSSFFQRWFGWKLVIRNVEVQGQKEVHVETYFSPSDQPQDLENWVLIYKVIDYVGANWSNIGTACNTPTPDQPITFGNSICTIQSSNNLEFRFKNLSIREIESFEEQVQNPPGGNDPGGGGDPNPEPEPPPDTEPPDTPTPPTPTIIQKRLTIKREIINNAFCQCDGIPDTGAPGGGGDPGGGGTGGGGGGTGGGGGGGGGGSLRTIYNVNRTSSTGFAKLASVSSNRDDFYLRYGQIADTSSSIFIGEIIGRIEIFLAERDRPRGGTGGGVHCRIRRGTNDSIAVDLGTAREADLHDAGSNFVFQKLDNTYAMQLNDKILFEYDGGDNDDYVKVFRRSAQPATGSKTVHRNNLQDAGEYSTSNRDMCMRVFAIAGTLSADTSDT